MGCKSTDQCLWCWVKWIAFLRNFEVTELAEDDLSGTECGSMGCKIFNICSFIRAVGTLSGCMRYEIVLGFTGGMLARTGGIGDQKAYLPDVLPYSES